jgi:transposase-like protein
MKSLFSEEKDETKEATEAKEWKCSDCGRAFDEEKKLLTHLKVDHGMSRPFNSSHPKSCNKVRRHILNHHTPNAGSHICHLCEKPFVAEKSLKSHLLLFHSDYRPFSCHLCERTFAEEVGLKSHVLLLHVEQRFHCRFCGKTFVEEVGMQRHIAGEHEEHPPVKCQFCKRSFSREVSLKIHVKVFHPDRIKSDHCEDTFGNKRSHVKHTANTLEN